MSSFIDHTLLQFAFSSVESLSIVQSKGQTILHIWPWAGKFSRHTISDIRCFTAKFCHFVHRFTGYSGKN